MMFEGESDEGELQTHANVYVCVSMNPKVLASFESSKWMEELMDRCCLIEKKKNAKENPCRTSSATFGETPFFSLCYLNTIGNGAIERTIRRQ